MWVLLALLVGAVLFASTPTSGAQGLAPPAIEALPGGPIVAGEIVVRLKPGTSDETRDQVLAGVDGVFSRVLPLPEGEAVVVKVLVGTEAAAADSLGVDTNVLYAGPSAVALSGAVESCSGAAIEASAENVECP